MNQALQELLDISSNQILNLIEQNEKESWIPTSLESFDSQIKRKLTTVSKSLNDYQERVQKGYEVIVQHLEKESASPK